jgi:hypothetical protein
LASPDPSQPAPTQRRTVRVRTREERADHHDRVRRLVARNQFAFSDHPYLQAPYHVMSAPDLVGPAVKRLIVAVDIDDTVADFTGGLRTVLFNRNRGLEHLFNALRYPAHTAETANDAPTRETFFVLGFENIYQGSDYDNMVADDCVFVQATKRFAEELDAAGRPLDQRSDPQTLREFLRVVLPPHSNYIFADDERWGKFIIAHEFQLSIVEPRVAHIQDDLPLAIQQRLRERHHDAIMASAAEEGFYRDLEWFPDSRAAMNEIADMGPIIMFNTKCTHVAGLYERIMADRIENIRQQDVPFTGDFVFANMVPKREYPFHVIFEDAAANIKDALESGRGAVCIDYIHNRGGTWVGTDGVERLFEEHPLFRRVSTPAEYPGALREIGATLAEMYGENLRLSNAPAVATGVGHRERLTQTGLGDVGLDAKERVVGRGGVSFPDQVLARVAVLANLGGSADPELDIGP